MLILGICPFNGSNIDHATVKRSLALSCARGRLGDFTKVSEVGIRKWKYCARFWLVIACVEIGFVEAAWRMESCEEHQWCDLARGDPSDAQGQRRG